MLKVVASPTIVILTNLEVSFILLANIYSRGINHDDRHVNHNIFKVQATVSITFKRKGGRNAYPDADFINTNHF